MNRARALLDRATAAARDPALGAAVLRACDQAVRAREAAIAGVPDYLAARERATEARRDSVARMPELIAELRVRLETAGIRVHRAPTAADAARFIAALADRHRVRSVVKAKTMVGEEIGLGPALEGGDRDVFETDLGEFIVQLRGERPSHLTAPALHVSRADVARLFADRLGMPYDETPATLAAFARAHLRRRFLEAGLGVVGVNWAVASTGDLATISNEGNGRLCATLPPVLVAVAGLDKVVATPADLAAVLRVTARNATGQAATTYVSLLRGPARPGEAFGPREAWLVLVDNGRSRIAEDAEDAEILRCLRCGACMNACPVYRTIGGHAYGTVYPGPVGIVLENALRGPRAAGHLAQACTLCGECGRVCPAGIDLPGRIRAIRTRAPVTGGKRAAFALAAWAMGGPGRWAALGWAARTAARGVPAVYETLARQAGWSEPGTTPLPAESPFRQQWKGWVPPPALQFEGMRPSAAFQEAAPAATRPEAASPRDPRDEFSRNFAAARGEESAAPAAVVAVDLARKLAVRSVLVDASAVEAGVASALVDAGHTVLRADDPALDRDAAAAAGLGVTGCLALAAETGSILLAHGPGRESVASLLPPVHLVLARPADIVASLEAALAIRDRSGARSATLVTGPSRTADIEKQLVLGMHGPKRLVLAWL